MGTLLMMHFIAIFVRSEFGAVFFLSFFLSLYGFNEELRAVDTCRDLLSLSSKLI